MNIGNQGSNYILYSLGILHLDSYSKSLDISSFNIIMRKENFNVTFVKINIIYFTKISTYLHSFLSALDFT